MKRNLIRYKTKPGRADENEKLVKGVFAELQTKSPNAIRYLVLRLDDGTFVHIVAEESKGSTNVISGLEAFRSFQSGIRDRCIEPPHSEKATVVGNYRMLGEQ